MFPSDKTVAKFGCGETKVMYLICHGIAPYLQTYCRDKIRGQQSVVMFDESFSKFNMSKQMDILVGFGMSTVWSVNIMILSL